MNGLLDWETSYNKLRTHETEFSAYGLGGEFARIWQNDDSTWTASIDGVASAAMPNITDAITYVETRIVK